MQFTRDSVYSPTCDNKTNGDIFIQFSDENRNPGDVELCIKWRVLLVARDFWRVTFIMIVT